MSQPSQSIWTTLQQAGLVQGHAPRPQPQESPWFVKVLLAFSGWLASLFLLGFLGTGFHDLLRHTAASAMTGSVMIAVAYFILRFPRNEFFEHVALAVSLAGQALITWSLFHGLKDDKLAWTLLALLQVGLAVVMPNFVHRVFSAFIAAYSFSMSLTQFGAPYIFSSVVMFVVAWLWLHEFNVAKHIRKIQAIGYGAVLGLIQLKGFDLFGIHHFSWRMGRINPELWVRPWTAEVLGGVVMVYVVWQLLQRMGHRLSDPIAITALVGTVILSAVSVEAPGITVGMIILLLGFAGSNRVLMGLGIVSLLFYIASFYYLLDATLLAKAGTLLVTGLVLLLARWLLLNVIQRQKETTHG